mgnify:FL=1
MLILKNRAELYAHLPPGVVAEIGVQLGDNAQDILEYGRPKELHLIDCWMHQTGGAYEGGPYKL